MMHEYHFRGLESNLQTRGLVVLAGFIPFDPAVANITAALVVGQGGSGNHPNLVRPI